MKRWCWRRKAKIEDVPPVRVDTAEAFVRAVDALWQAGGPPVEVPTLEALRSWGFTAEEEKDAAALGASEEEASR